ncbi:unnamed protein product [Calicophoron daubneyi]|uniref:Uncharacterized protein n=1 Tax=Calicophoron daubneyi TaxID=300641 RepID=A0AAV2T3Z6_CALDB
MPDNNNSCGAEQLSNARGANFVSPLQKASSRDPKADKCPWLDQCYEVSISSSGPDSTLSLPIDGGSDAGMFCVVGSHLESSRIVYHNLSSSTKLSNSLKPGDIILTVNDYEISGYTRRDAVELCDTLTRFPTEFGSFNRPRIRLRLSPPEALATGNTMLSSFLAAAFPLNSPEYSLQEKIRENVYQRVVPCNHYGTPRPEPNATALDGVLLNQLSISTSSSVQMADDPCPIPPPLPPLSSFASTPSESSSTGGSQTHMPPPPPPVRHSSITNQSTAVKAAKMTTPVTRTNGFPDTSDLPKNFEESYPPTSAPNSTDGRNSVDLGPLSPRWKRVDESGSRSYLIDCDISPNHWKDSAVYVNDPIISPSAGVIPSSEIPGSDMWNPTNESSVPLPYGWEIVRDPKYGSFYIDHINKRTQYEPPTEEDFVMAAAVQSQVWSTVDANLSNHSNSVSATVDSGYSQPIDSTATTTTNIHSCSPQQAPDGRISPTVFTTDPQQIRGPVVTTTLVKSPRGFGFTIIGGADCNRPGFLQVKHLIPGGPASVNSCLSIGDVMVMVNSTNVLGYTHAQIVTLFQSIPVGSSVNLTVSQGYRLRRDLPDSTITTPIPNARLFPSPALTVKETSIQNQIPTALPLDLNHPQAQTSFRRDSPNFSGSSLTSTTNSPHLSLSPPSSLVGAKSHESPTSIESPSANAPKMRLSQRPEFLKVTIFKQPNGFGFTLADHPQGQHVKAIVDPVRCGRLRVGDVVVEINDQRVKEVPHAEVVQMLKMCPVGQEAHLLIQRGGLYTGPLSLMASDQGLSRTSATDDKIHPSAQGVLDLKPSIYVDSKQTSDVTDSKPAATTTHNSVHFRTSSLASANLNGNGSVYSADTVSRNRSQTPGPELDRKLGVDVSAGIDPLDLACRRGNHPPISFDRRRRMRPVDDSVLDIARALPRSPNPSLNYGSLLRPGRMPPLRIVDTSSNHVQSSRTPIVSSAANEIGGSVTSPGSFMMLPGEFLVHLERQSTGFGFTVMGGAEENSQVIIGSLVPGGAAQLSGVVRTGDRLISINGTRVVGAKHREVVQLLDKAAYTVGQVTLGLQRQKLTLDDQPKGGDTYNPMRDAVEVVVPRSQKGDGFGFFITNLHPKGSALDSNNPNRSKLEGEYIAQLVPGSKAERLGLLSVGDRILAVNKKSILGLRHEQVVRLIRESGNNIVLTIVPSSTALWASRSRNESYVSGAAPVEFPVTLFRGSRGFGFSIRGGQEFNKMPLLVLRIADGGAAQRDGRLRVGDELIEINGYPTMGMSHGRAIEIIQAGGNIMRLVVRRYPHAKYAEGCSAHQRQPSYQRSKANQQHTLLSAAEVS